jgi:hypothetical protein
MTSVEENITCNTQWTYGACQAANPPANRTILTSKICRRNYKFRRKNKDCKTGAEEEMAKSFSKKNTCSVLQKLFNPLP